MTIAPARRNTVAHPLSALTAAEIDAARDILTDAGLVGAETRFVYVGLDEPAKADVHAFTPGDDVERRIRVLLLDRSTGTGSDHVVSITEGLIVSSNAVDASREGHVPILDAEFDDIESFLLASDDWLTAMSKRNIDPQNVR